MALLGVRHASGTDGFEASDYSADRSNVVGYSLDEMVLENES